MRAADSARAVHLCAYSQARIFAHKWPAHALRLTQALCENREMEITRKKIFLYWFALGVVTSALTATVSMLFWNTTYVPDPDIDWVPINDIGGMFVVMPFGWLLSIATPAGWLSIFGLVLAMYKRNMKPLIFSAVGSALFGVFWPEIAVGLLGI